MKNWISTLILGGALALGGPALAEQSGSAAQGDMPQQSQGATAQTPNFEDEELQTFVDIQEDIGEVRNEYAQKIQNAESQEEAQSLQREARESLVKVVEDANLSVEKYNEIAQAYQADPEVREKVNKMAQK